MLEVGFGEGREEEEIGKGERKRTSRDISTPERIKSSLGKLMAPTVPATARHTPNTRKTYAVCGLAATAKVAGTMMTASMEQV